jgi:hypothetical protein
LPQLGQTYLLAGMAPGATAEAAKLPAEYLPCRYDPSFLPQCGQMDASGDSINRWQCGQNLAPHFWQTVALGSFIS